MELQYSPKYMKIKLITLWLFSFILAYADPQISEFLASNDSGLRDEDGDRGDWIEIVNPDSTSVSLSGWSLTDDASDLTKWTFPNVSLNPGERIVVFASGKDRAVAGSELHTNFSLSRSGEYLALVKPGGAKASEFNTYPEQKEDISYGLSSSEQLLVDRNTSLKYLLSVPANDAQGDVWTEDDYDDSGWNSDTVPTLRSDAGGLPSPTIGSNQSTSSNITMSGLPNSLNGNAVTLRVDIARNANSSVSIDLTSPAGTTVTVLTNLQSGAEQTLVLNNFGNENPNGQWTLTMRETSTFFNFGRSRLDAWSLETTGIALPARGGFGYDTTGAYSSLIDTPVSSGQAEAYLRYAFNVADVSNISGLTLRTRHDDGFEAYLNGTLIHTFNTTNPPQSQTSTEFISVDVSSFISSLKSGNNVLTFRLVNSSASSSDFLMLPELVASTSATQYRYSPSPSPNAANTQQTFLGFVKDTKFTVGRGFYSASFSETISSSTPGATIIYTTDGSEPSLSNGTQITPASSTATPSGNVAINRTIPIRAIGVKTGYLPTNVDTNTYIFTSDVKTQSSANTQSVYGFPSNWNGTNADHGMDTDVIGPGDLFAGIYASSVETDLKAIPTLSIVMNTDDMFGSNGIYSNPEQSGSQWERATSFELIHPDGTKGFQENCGIRIQGGAFRSFNLARKKSFRILFKKEYGNGKLSHDFFGEGATKEFNTITLRMMSNDGWNFNSTVPDALFVRDEFGRRVQRSMGQVASHGNWMHLYINGVYWGLYHPVERPDSSFAEAYFGIDEDEWDGINSGSATNSNDDPDRATRAINAWNTMISLADNVRTASGTSAKHAAYMRVQGLNPDGSNNTGFEDYLDIENYIDYLIINHYGANRDWPFKNYYCGRHNSSQSTGFKFFSWDYEWTLDYDESSNVIGRASVTHNNIGDFRGVAEPYEDLRSSDAFNILFADRIHRAIFNNGPLAGNNPLNLFTELTDAVRSPLVGESARWGDQSSATPMTVNAEWETNVNSMKTSWLPNRRDNLLAQYRSAGLYPNTEAPFFNQHGGVITAGFSLTMGHTNSGGTIYYTTNGTDPLQINSDGSFSISASATAYSSAATLNNNTQVKARVLNGGEWSALNEAEFVAAVTASASNLVISEFSYQSVDSAAGAGDGDEFEYIEIQNIGSSPVDLSTLEFDSGITFDFSVLSLADRNLAAGARAVVVENTTAFVSRYGNGPKILGQWTGKLSNGGETIRLRIKGGTTIKEFTYDDDIPWPTCADGDGFSLVLINPESNPDHNLATNWRCSIQLNGNPGSSDALPAFTGVPNADNDGDSVPELLEHFMGTSDGDASDSNGKILLNTEEMTEGSTTSTYLTLTFPRKLGNDDLTYAVEMTTSLLPNVWQSGTQHVVLLRQTHNADGTVTETWRTVEKVTDNARMFMRLRVNRP